MPSCLSLLLGRHSTRYARIGLSAASVLAFAGVVEIYTSPTKTRFFTPWKIVLRANHILGFLTLSSTNLYNAAAADSPAEVQSPVLPSRIGINLTPPSGQRAFANLAISDTWRIVNVPKNWSEFPRENLLPDGGLAALPTGTNAVRMLNKPATGPLGVDIRCSWLGSGNLLARGAPLSNLSSSSSQLFFHWNYNLKDGVWLQVASVDPHRPIHNLDCRETSMARDARFDPAFVKSLVGYKVLRFTGWQRTNENESVSWATRTQPNSIENGRGSGVAIEDMVALAKATHAAAWFCMPWNANNDYVARFAHYVHDALPADQLVYVEVGNEIWNVGFDASRQAISEGLAANLADNPKQAHLFRLAERTVDVMKIWEKVFADQPKRLVRVISTQHVTPDSAAQILARRDTADHVDALATAPYFGDLMHEGQTSDLTEIFRRLNDRIEKTIDTAVANRAVAARYGLRYIAYEAGQHVVLPYNVPLTVLIQRDPRMYGTYKHYIEAWRHRVGDTLMLFADVSTIRTSGAWGLAERNGQPISETPKLRAVLEERDR